MIVRSRPTFFDVLFTLRGSIARHIAWQLLAISAFAAVVTALAQMHPTWFARLSATPFTLIGLSLSIFMSFRNSACYDRWWEGRRQWGSILTEIRSLCRATQTLAPDPARDRLLRACCGWCHGLAARMRDGDERLAVKDWLAQPLPAHLPNATDSVLAVAGAELGDLVTRGRVTDWHYGILEQRLVALSAIQAACERIRFTPLPYAYTLLLHRTAYLFCGLLPFGLADQLGWATPLVTAIVSYTFFGLDALGNELEEPFGLDDNDLPLDAMVRTIEREILAALGSENLPLALVPENGSLH